MSVRALWLSLSGLVLLGAAGVILAGCGDAKQTTSALNTASPEAVAGRFFHWYASERNLGKDPIGSGAIDGNADVSPRFSQTLKAAAAAGTPGIDPLLCSMTVPHAFQVENARISGASASLTVSADAHPMAWRTDLTRNGAVWQVAAVSCLVR